MIKKVEIKNSNTSLVHLKENELSIQFNLDGFSFCITNQNEQKTLYFCKYSFENSVKTPEKLLLKIQEIFSTDSHLQKDFSKVTVIHSNNLSTLVPSKYFKEDQLASYLKFNIKVLATDFIAFDAIAAQQIKNVYVPYVNINNYLFNNFGEFDYKHHTTVLIENYTLQNTGEETTMYVNVDKSTLDITILKAKKVVLLNSFTYHTKEDFMYYILFVAEQLNLDTAKFKLYFTGEIDKETSLYKIAYLYIKNMYLLESNNSIFKILDLPKHTNYTLLGS